MLFMVVNVWLLHVIIGSSINLFSLYCFRLSSVDTIHRFLTHVCKRNLDSNNVTVISDFSVHIETTQCSGKMMDFDNHQEIWIQILTW